ncbi:Transcriptional regulator, MerR family [Actinokineospora spheciospongiae]|uniref:Transcriptional regulator, MerR family n=1 Tax=Actinokineospora spheciospongiae TaxID=909613 RepID=W7IDQ3_9PSEU|nr:MerR family transcriptional regulator [Actinokineospora spheciospongiae]EWC59005.1 Transcriptional regulator, MerR family [Actinokineospora spheciospongiae]PWW65704.1 DNA-binding transcriptional MerR regulator [Actinokineospora spheciospongiae]
MAWSTRQIAELAGTSVRAVRHYHEVGLLAEPERRANGYKRYGVAHLVRLLRIKRLTDLGFSLPQIAGMGNADEHPEEALRALDAEVAGTIERLQRVRAELALILDKAAPTDLPAELAQAAADAKLTAADRSFVVVMSRLLSPSAITAYRGMLEAYSADPSTDEFDHLPPDADEQTREDLARRMVGYIRELQADHPGMRELKADTPAAARLAAQTMATALHDLYSPAQVDVIRRVGRLLALDPG